MNRFWLGLLFLTWRISRSTEGAKDECPSPPPAEFAEFSAESYRVGTQVKYKCDEGYKRPGGQARFIKCSSDPKDFGRWTSVVCIENPSLPPPSTLPATRTEEDSGRTDGPLTTAQPLMKDFCGVFKPPKHGKAMSMSYAVGQELQYRCLDGYQARSPISEKITCQNIHGRTAWRTLHLRCTNDTMYIEKDITPETGTSDVPSSTTATHPQTVIGKHAVSPTSAAVIYRASAAFAIPLMATMVIL